MNHEHDKACKPLTRDFLAHVKLCIEAAIIPVMESLYGHGSPDYRRNPRPGMKELEKVVSFYDYNACGISVLARLAAAGHQPARRLVANLLENTNYYCSHIHGQPIAGYGIFKIPLRRLLLHLALAYQALENQLDSETKASFIKLAEQQVPLAIAHCKNFHPGRHDLYLAGVNNHTAIFMLGICYCGQAFDRPDWSELAREFAERYYASGHPDGYFEEHTNAAREGGPSLTYTPLTAGCLYDLLDGCHRPRRKLVKAGEFYRSMLNQHRARIPIADERTNSESATVSHGLALHSLTPPGRAFIMSSLENMNYSSCSPEALAVIDHEIELMKTGPAEPPEYLLSGHYRITLPLGILRRNGFTAGISALRALNQTQAPEADYALDQQAMVYLAHYKAGTILNGYKAKRNPAYSTFRLGDDAYTIRTGNLKMSANWAEATLHYRSFTGLIRWEIEKLARLKLQADSEQIITTTLPFAGNAEITASTPFKIIQLRGFSPYHQDNTAPSIPALQFKWRKELTIEFTPGPQLGNPANGPA